MIMFEFIINFRGNKLIQIALHVMFVDLSVAYFITLHKQTMWMLQLSVLLLKVYPWLSIVTSLRAGRRANQGSIPGTATISHHSAKTNSGVEAVSFLSGSFLGMKQPGSEAGLPLRLVPR